MGTNAASDFSTDSEAGGVSMADALFSGTRQTLLGLLFGQPDRGYTLTELIEMAQAGRGAVQREIARLVEAGLVRQHGRSRGRLYRANPESPIYQELCGIARKVLGPANVIREALLPLKGQVRAAVLYGSVAQGMDRADSDIDVLIVSDELLLEDVFEALSGAERALGRSVNPTMYTSEEYNQRRKGNSPFLADVLQGDHEILLGALD
jgi:predicted nucleotidyltransferase